MIEYCFLYLSFILVKPNGQKSRCQLSDKWGRCGLCHMWGHHPNTSGKMTQTESGIDHERCLAVSPTACERHQYADATCENYSSGATLDGTARTGRAVLSILSHFKSGTNQSEICGRRRLRQFYLRGWMLVTPLTENSDKLSSTQQQGGVTVLPWQGGSKMPRAPRAAADLFVRHCDVASIERVSCSSFFQSEKLWSFKPRRSSWSCRRIFRLKGIIYMWLKSKLINLNNIIILYYI